MTWENKKKQLLELGTNKLAETLIELAIRNDDVADVVDRLIATPAENVKRFKAKLSGLKRARSFIDWRGVNEFSQELEGLLADLQAGVKEPKTGVELTAKFFECDGAIFERCDDSSGTIGDIFRYDAQELFVHFAKDCDDKPWLCELLTKLNEKDDYGIRDVLVDSASKFLPAEYLRKLSECFWKKTEKYKSDSWEIRHWFSGVESLARQLGDAPLFEKTRLASRPEVNSPLCLDIAEVYLETGSAKTALFWVERIPEKDRHLDYKLEQLLLKIYRELGEQEKLAETAWRIFRSSRSKENLEMLLEIIGEAERNRVIDEQLQNILKSDKFSNSDAQFLIDVGRLGDTASYILNHTDNLDGNFYYSLLPLAESMEKEEYWLAATAVYRALLESILKRAVSKYYHHGVRYLKKLDMLAGKVTDWQNMLSHEAYHQEIMAAHSRKRAFWGKYE